MRPIRKIVVLGANGAMGAGAAAVFASAGIPTTMLARTVEKAEAGRAKAEQMAKGKVPPKSIAIGTYDNDLAKVAAEADLIFECVAEDLETNRRRAWLHVSHPFTCARTARRSSGVSSSPRSSPAIAASSSQSS